MFPSSLTASISHCQSFLVPPSAPFSPFPQCYYSHCVTGLTLVPTSIKIPCLKIPPSYFYNLVYFLPSPCFLYLCCFFSFPLFAPSFSPPIWFFRVSLGLRQVVCCSKTSLSAHPRSSRLWQLLPLQNCLIYHGHTNTCTHTHTFVNGAVAGTGSFKSVCVLHYYLLYRIFMYDKGHSPQHT